MSDHQTIYATGSGEVAKAFANQVKYCEANDAPITARVVAALGACVADPQGNAFFRRMAEWTGAPLADALALRGAGGLHALHLAGGEPSLAAIYAGEPAEDAALVRAVANRREADLLPWLDGPPQTNEAGRSSNFIAAMAWLAAQGCPARFECLEIGSSGGINLMLARYHYDLGGARFGPEDAAMRFAPEWRGAALPRTRFEILSTRGCDVAPADLTDPAQALRLRAYVWPEHTVRFQRMDAAIAEAQRAAPDLVHANAADFVEAELAKPQADGTTRVLMHSIVWQYVPRDQQARIRAAMQAAAARATPGRALAWVALEANRTVHRHELTAQAWPAVPQRQQLADAHAHGAWIEWHDPPQASTWPE